MTARDISPPAGSPPPAPLSNIAERVMEIVDVAERVAESIREEAEREAERYLAERRTEVDRSIDDRIRALSEAEENLLARLEHTRDELGALIESLRGAVRNRPTGAVEQALAAEPGADAAREPAASSGLRPVAYAGRRTPGSFSAGTEPAADPLPPDAILRATQLAIAGRDREEIEAALRDELGVADPGVILESVLGR